MDPITIGILGTAALLIFIALGVHIGLALATVGFLGIIAIAGLEAALSMMTTGFYFRLASYALITIPLFVIMGLLASAGGIGKDLYDGLSLWFGRFRPGLGIATTVACAGFGTICGSSAVTASVFAKISAPEMRLQGYDKKIAYGVCATAGAIGMLIPPSVLAVFYGFMSGDSIGRLLIGGIVPGVLLTIAISLALVLIPYIKPEWIASSPLARVGVSWRQRIAVIPTFWPVVLVGGVIFGGVFGGVFSPTEGGAVAAFLLIVLTFVTKRRASLKVIKDSFFETATLLGMATLVVGGATVFSRFLTISGITTAALGWITGVGLDNLTLVIAIAMIYIVLGMFLDSLSMVSITVPILTPVITALGIDPIWYAIVAIFAMHVGLVTPPFGLDVYTAKAVAEPDVSVEDIFAGSVPFFLSMLAVLAIAIAFPNIITFLPNLMFGK